MTDNLPEPNLHKDIPAGLHMMNHVYRCFHKSQIISIDQRLCRSANYTKPGHYVKCFHNTEHVLTIHNHFPTRCIGKQLWLIRVIVICVLFKGGTKLWCKNGGVDTGVGHLQHYREFCVSDLKNVCVETYMKHVERDTSVWRWRENVTRALTEKGLVSIDIDWEILQEYFKTFVFTIHNALHSTHAQIGYKRPT